VVVCDSSGAFVTALGGGLDLFQIADRHLKNVSFFHLWLARDIFFDGRKDHALELKQAVIDAGTPLAFSQVLSSPRSVSTHVGLLVYGSR